MSRKKSQAQSIDEKEDDEQSKEQNSEMILPEDNVFNIDSKVNNNYKQNNINDDSTSMEKHHKFSKFSKFKK